MTTRLSKVRDELKKKTFDAVLVSSPSNITYLTNYSNFLPIEREAFLFITKNERYIITDGRYSEAVLLQIPDFELIERSVKNPLGNIFKNLAKKYRVKKLGAEEDNLTIAEYKLIKKHFNNTCHYSVSSLRAIKDENEISLIEKACELGDKAFDYVLNKIKKGVSEKEVAFELEYYIKKQGAELSFPSIVAFGKNSSVPHHQTSNQRLASSGQFVLLDFGVRLNNYCSDMTRTIFFGKPNDEQKRMYQTVLTAQQKAIERLTSDGGPERSRRNSPEVDEVARNYIIEQGYPTIPHSLGHGIGLEVHESPSLSPNSKSELKPGMVFSIEPGIYLPAGRQGKPGFGGVRIEDLVVIEKKGIRLLTKSKREMISI